jgi:hypothetical protein
MRQFFTYKLQRHDIIWHYINVAITAGVMNMNGSLKNIIVTMQFS